MKTCEFLNAEAADVFERFDFNGDGFINYGDVEYETFLNEFAECDLDLNGDIT